MKQPVQALQMQLQQAFAAQASGQLDKAETMAKKILKINPKEFNSLYLLGIISHQKGDLKNAEKFFKKSYQINKNNPGAISGLAMIYMAARRFDECIKMNKEALKFAPNDEGIINNMALAHKEKGDIYEAVRVFHLGLKHHPKSGLLYLGLGQSYNIMGMHNEAFDAWSSGAKYAPDMPAMYNGLGMIYRFRGQNEQALEQFEKALALTPHYQQAQINQSASYVDLGDFEKAEEILKSCLVHNENDMEAVLALAEMMRSQKRSDEANAYYERALTIENTSTDSYTTATWYHRRALCYDQMKEWDQAFIHYKQFNDIMDELLKKSGSGYSAKELERNLSNQKDVFNQWMPDLDLEDEHNPHLSCKPIFVVGMPRSSTTLTEQILSSHPEVFGAGELTVLNDAILKFATKKTTDWSKELASLTREELREIAQTYIDYIDGLAPDALHVVDKLPTNFMHIGMIRTLFPNAHIVHCIRNPMDTCVSIYSQHFATQMRYDHNLSNLAHFYTIYVRMMEYWHQRFDGKIYDITYETLVADQEAESRALIAAMGLEWDDACLSFHKTKRSVTTASRLQVRQPIYKSSMAKWKRYESHLKPLMDGLKGYVPDHIFE